MLDLLILEAPSSFDPALLKLYGGQGWLPERTEIWIVASKSTKFTILHDYHLGILKWLKDGAIERPECRQS